MRYKQKIVELPEGMKVGSKIFIRGEGWDEFYVDDIIYYPDGTVNRIVNSSGFREALCKLVLCKPHQNAQEAFDDPTNLVKVAIGECDYGCGVTFPDSCSYHCDRDPRGSPSMICDKCYNKHIKNPKPKAIQDHIDSHEIPKDIVDKGGICGIYESI